MTADLEFQGKNVDKAVEQAAKTLQIPVEKIHYEILSHGSTGIFGLAGIKKARIRVHHAGPPKPNSDAVSVVPPTPNTSATIATEAGSHDETDPQTIGEGVLRRMVDAISPEAEINVAKDDKGLRFEVVGGQSGILIGKRGQTLEAMQLIVEKAVRRTNGHDLRLQVDVEGYRAKKRAGLERTALRVAQKVADKGVPSSLGYLSAQDRRTVHLALKEDPQVRTKSVGEGPIRKLMIFPQRRSKTRH
jgi:spoIIIJ-associated protein